MVRAVAAAAVEPPSSPVVVRGSDWYVRDTLTSGTADHTFTYGLPGDLQLLSDGDANPGGGAGLDLVPAQHLGRRTGGSHLRLRLSR